MKQIELTHDYLLEILEYFPHIGTFVWKVNRRSKKCLGKEAGNKDKKEGRHHIKINQKTYLRSRLAWFYVHGKWPKEQIDHENRIPDDDRIDNLREATNQENQWNATSKRKKYPHLPRNISFKGNKFLLKIRFQSKDKYLGTFSNIEDAIKARDEFDLVHRKLLYENFSSTKRKSLI